MAKQRVIKYEFFLNENLAALDPLARLLFIGLWTICDREGRLEYRPARIKAQIFPYHDANVEALLGSMGQFVTIYGSNGDQFIQVNKFSEHQHPHPGEKISVIQELDDSCNVIKLDLISSNVIRPNVNTNVNTNVDVNPNVAPSPSDSEPPVLVFKATGKKEWGLTESKRLEWAESYPGVDVLSECRKARQWCIDNPTKNKTAKGMPAFLSRWLSRAQDSGKSKTAPASHNSPPPENERFRRLQEREDAEWGAAAEATK